MFPGHGLGSRCPNRSLRPGGELGREDSTPEGARGRYPPISGLFVGTGALFASEGQLFGDAVAEAALGRLSERETRNELGNFMTSLLVRAGIVAFDPPGAALGSSGGKAEDGSWSAWTGPTPMVLSVSRTIRSQSVRER